MKAIDGQQNYYDSIGFSDRIGFGERPAVLVIDMCRGITEPGYKMFIDMDEHIPRIQAILSAARAAGAPVVFTTVAYHRDLADAGIFGRKCRLVRDLLHGSERVEIDLRLPVEDSDHLLVKKMPSAFHGTHLHAMLTGLGGGHDHRGRQFHERLRARHRLRRGVERVPAHRPRRLRGGPGARLPRGEPLRHRREVCGRGHQRRGARLSRPGRRPRPHPGGRLNP